MNQVIKGGKAKIRTQPYIKLNTGAKDIQQVNRGGPDNSQCIRPLRNYFFERRKFVLLKFISLFCFLTVS